jgi:hypothetical protein
MSSERSSGIELPPHNDNYGDPCSAIGIESGTTKDFNDPTDKGTPLVGCRSPYCGKLYEVTSSGELKEHQG